MHKCSTFNVTRFRCVEYQKAKRAVVSDCIIVINQRLLAKSGCHSENGCYKEQLLSNFLENSGNFLAVVPGCLRLWRPRILSTLSSPRSSWWLNCRPSQVALHFT